MKKLRSYIESFVGAIVLIIVCILTILFWQWLTYSFFKIAIYLWNEELVYIDRLGTPSAMIVIFINNIMVSIFGEWANNISSVVIFGVVGFFVFTSFYFIYLAYLEFRDWLKKKTSK